MQNQAQPKPEQHLTVKIIPHGSSEPTISFKFKLKTLVALCCCAGLLGLTAVSALVYSAMLSRKLISYKLVLDSNQDQQAQLAYFSLESAKLQSAVRELTERDNEIRRMMGIKPEATDTKLGSVVVSEERKKLDNRVGVRLGSIYGDYKKAEVELAKRKESLASLQRAVRVMRQQFATTPSSWPIYGSVVSGFGYRYFPWRGFHTGIDITAWYGAPVRATANGVVSYVGWRSGYGKTVMLDHGGGITTLYAHNSRFAVVDGQPVSKGQIICYVGTTGLSTGPHCHYEIRRNDQPINPVAYLNKDVLAAARSRNY